jgi:hypothetical protein
MKIFFLIPVVLFLSLLLGCQENPVSQFEASQILKDKPPTEHSIKLCCEIKDPYSNVCNLNGMINYDFKIIDNTMNPRATTLISLRIYIHASLCDKLRMMPCVWIIEGKSDEIVQVSEEGILLLEKCYSITNRNDVFLLVKYLVTTNGVGISSVDLVPLERKISENL